MHCAHHIHAAVSFRGRLLIETSPLTVNYTASPLFEPGWISVPSAQILAQPAFFFLSQSETKPEQTRFFSVPVDPKSGLFCALLPSGTYLAFASAGAEDNVLGKAYEEVALAVSLRPDQNNGRIQIRLQRQVSKIEFHSPADMNRRLQRLAEGSSESRCGQLRSIGKSAGGEDLYVFEMGLNRSILRLNPVQTNSEGNEEYERLLPADEDALNGTQLFASLFPKVILFGNLDGTDLLTPQLLTHFVEWLCLHRENQSAVTRLLSTVQLAVIPVPNPDRLSTAWENTLSQSRRDLMDEEVCLTSVENGPPEISWRFSTTESDGDRMRLWNELIDLTKARTLNPHHWWWESPQAANLSDSLSVEVKTLVSWMRTYQPNAILSLPSGASSPSIDYGLDLMEGDVAQEWISETHKWLRFLGHLMAPGFHRYSSMCSEKGAVSKALLTTSHSTIQRVHRLREHLMLNTVAVGSRSRQWDSSQLMPLALSLASMSPELALNELPEHQLQHSRSFPPPLPLTPPVSLALTLCPACLAASPIGIARVWSDFRLPSLLVGLLSHASLTAQGSSGLIGQVVVRTIGELVPEK
ncbi:unnamed protein product [Echinostoma caproni]|uniref:Peptidase_M14 domain-containing protein n=1 Tax=Echinostoma caproni TaxID=27848 RepID=A0A183AXK6_9TREM|nr:unnamed protein product [Echinostoma caproni]